LGYYHYATIGIRLAPSRPRPVTVPETHPVEVQPASVRVAPIVATPPARPAEVIYFDPRRERARITVEVRTPSVLGASLLDEGGKALRELIAPHDVVPGAYVVEWDGVLETGPARLNQTYIMRISYDATTEFVNVIPKEAP
jgi:hypothetical protein